MKDITAKEMRDAADGLRGTRNMQREWTETAADLLDAIADEREPQYKAGDRVRVACKGSNGYGRYARITWIKDTPDALSPFIYYAQLDGFDHSNPYVASSLEPAPPELLPVGTLVVVDHPQYQASATIKMYIVGNDPHLAVAVSLCKPYIPAYLARGTSGGKTTGNWRVTDGVLMVEVENLMNMGNDEYQPCGSHWWPLAKCTGLQLDPIMQEVK